MFQKLSGIPYTNKYNINSVRNKKFRFFINNYGISIFFKSSFLDTSTNGFNRFSESKTFPIVSFHVRVCVVMTLINTMCWYVANELFRRRIVKKKERLPLPERHVKCSSLSFAHQKFIGLNTLIKSRMIHRTSNKRNVGEK